MVKSKPRTTGSLQSLKDILLKYDLDNCGKYVSKEFQDYGYRLALELNDARRVSLYIKLAKIEDRVLLEKARSFVKDANNIKSRSRLFMWKLSQLKKDKK